MKRKRFTEEQIISILKEREAGMKVAELGRSHGVSEQSIYRWQGKYGGLEVSEAKRLRLLEEENRRLKRMVADLSLDKQMLEDVIKQSKKTGNACGQASSRRPIATDASSQAALGVPDAKAAPIGGPIRIGL